MFLEVHGGLSGSRRPRIAAPGAVAAAAAAAASAAPAATAAPAAAAAAVAAAAAAAAAAAPAVVSPSRCSEVLGGLAPDGGPPEAAIFCCTGMHERLPEHRHEN